MAITKKEEEGKTSTEKKEKISFEDSPKKEKAVAKTTEVEEKEIVVEEEDVTDNEPAMPVSAVEGLLKRMEERLTNQFNDKLQKLRLGKAKAELEADGDYIADLEDDWLDVPVVFFAYSINFSIHGDKQRGKATVPPQGPVRFKPIIRTKRRRGKEEEVISVSSVKVHSRSVADWLRNHSQFGIAFFENMDSVLNIDSGWAQRLIEANQSIQRLSDQQVIARCRQENLTIGTDIVKMRKELVANIAEKSIKHQEEMRNGKLKRAIVDKNSDRQIVERTIPQ
jgi:hypothetical protein